MALTSDQVNNAYLKVLGRRADPSGIQTYSQFNTPQDVENDLYNSSEFKNNQFNPNTAQFQAKPLSSADLGGYAQQAQQMYAPIQQATNNRLAALQAQAANNTQQLEDRLKQNAGYATQAMNENMNNMGLLQSGQTAAGSGLINRDLSYNLNQAEIQKALNDADLALQGAQSTAGVQGAAINQANNLAQQNYGIRALNAQNNNQNFQNALNLSQLQYATPQTRSLNLGQFGTVPGLGIQSQGIQELLTNPYALSQFLHTFDENGNIMTDRNGNPVPNPVGQQALGAILNSYGIDIAP